jgi:hypothetical protein
MKKLGLWRESGVLRVGYRQLRRVAGGIMTARILFRPSDECRGKIARKAAKVIGKHLPDEEL